MANPIGAVYNDPTSTLEIRYDDGTGETISPITQQQAITRIFLPAGGANDAANKTTVASHLTNKLKPGKTVVSKPWK